MKISLITGLITLVIGTLGDNCPSFFGGVGCSEIQCVNGGYADSDKNICICPPGYLGIHCEAVKTSRPPKNHYKTGGTSFNILNVNLYTQYWGFKTYENIRTAVEAFQEAYKFDFYNYRYSTGAPSLDQFDNPQGFPIEFEQPPTTSISLNGPTDTGLYWCYQVDIYENLVETIRNASLRNTAITIITQHPPTPDQLEEAQQTTVAFGIRVNVLWISDKTFNRCKNADIAAFKAFSELTGGLFVQLQSELDDAPTQKLVSQVLLTHYRPQFVSIQSFDSCDSPQSVPVVIDPVVKGPYNFVFLGTNALPTSQSFVSCLLQQPLRSFDKKLSFFQSPDPMCQSISVQASGPCTVMVFTNGNYSNPGPVDLSIYTSYVEDQTIDSSRYGMVESVPFYPAIHVEPPSPSSQVTVNSISTSFNSSWNPVLQNRFPAAYEWIPSKTITCDSSKTYSLFLNITVDGSIVQRAVRVACLAAPPPTTIPAETTTVAITTTVTVPSTVETTVTTVTVPSTTETTVTTETVVSSTSTFTTATPCSQPGVPYSFLLSYSTELDSKTFGLVSSTIVQAVRNYPYNNITLTDSYLDSTNDTIQKPASVNDFSIDLEAKLPSPTNALGETLGSNVVPILQKFIAATEGPDKPISYDNSVLLLLPNRLQTSTASDLEDSNYIDFVNKNVKVFTVISLASLIAQGQMVGRTGKVFNRLAAASNGHYIVANETIFGRDVNSDYNKVVAQVMQFGYGQDLLFSRNIGSTRLRTDIGTVSIPKSASGFINITITVSLSVVDTNAPNPPTRLLLALKPAAGSTSGATAINFLTDTTVTRYETSNFYIITITVPAGEDRGMVLQYIPGVDDNDLLIRMWVDRSTYHKAKYVNLALDDGVPDDKEGAALRMTLQNNCYNSIDTHCQAKILITDCNGDVSTKYGSSQVSGNTLTADPAFKYFGFVPFFCDSPPSTSTSCIAGTEAKYDVQFNFEDYSVTRSFWCSKSSEPFDPKCTKQDAYGNYQCTGNSPFKTGPTGKVPDCSGHGSLTVDFTEGIGKEVYSCQCEDGFHPPNCASAKCFSPNLDRLATDNSYHTFTLVMGLDNSVSTFAVIQQDLEKFLKLSAVPSIWKYQLLAYCTDGSVTNLYSGGDFKEFYAMMNTSTIPVNCADCSGPIDGSVDLTTVYNSAVQGIGRNVRGMIVYYTESQKTLAVSLDDFVVASRAYRQELFVFTGYYNETSPTPLPPGNANISLAAISTGGFYVQSLVDTARYILKISDDFVSTILSGKSSLAYVSTEQTTGFNVAVNSTTTVAWVVAWGNGGKFVSDNRAILSESICKTADDTMAMCKLTGATSYNFVAPSDGNAYTTAVFITNEDYLSPRFQIISDLNQDASNAVSTTSSATRTIISMYVPPGYKIVDNDGDGGLTRTIQRDHCTFQSTAYSVFADSKYSAGANTAMITLQQEDGNISSPKYTRYFTFGTSSSPICQNGGTPVASTGSCACPTGFQGPDCSLVNCELASSANAWSDVCVCTSLEDVSCANRYTSLF